MLIESIIQSNQTNHPLKKKKLLRAQEMQTMQILNRLLITSFNTIKNFNVQIKCQKLPVPK